MNEAARFGAGELAAENGKGRFLRSSYYHVVIVSHSPLNPPEPYSVAKAPILGILRMLATHEGASVHNGIRQVPSFGISCAFQNPKPKCVSNGTLNHKLSEVHSSESKAWVCQEASWGRCLAEAAEQLWHTLGCRTLEASSVRYYKEYIASWFLTQLVFVILFIAFLYLRVLPVLLAASLNKPKP